jgi:hypothetical protein
MKIKVIYTLIVLLFFGCTPKAQKTRNEKAKENSYIDSIRICKLVVNEMTEQMKRGNLFWFKDFDNIVRAQEYLMDNYNILLYPEGRRYHCAQLYMEPIISQKYGKDFFERTEKEISLIYKDIPDIQNIDKNYYYAEVLPEYTGGTDSLYSDIYKMIPNLLCKKINLEFGAEIIIKFIIDINGKVKNVKVYQKLCVEMDNLVINAIYNLPKKWKPAIYEGKKVPYIVTLSIDWKERQ